MWLLILCILQRTGPFLLSILIYGSRLACSIVITFLMSLGFTVMFPLSFLIMVICVFSIFFLVWPAVYHFYWSELGSPFSSSLFQVSPTLSSDQGLPSSVFWWEGWAFSWSFSCQAATQFYMVGPDLGARQWKKRQKKIMGIPPQLPSLQITGFLYLSSSVLKDKFQVGF